MKTYLAGSRALDSLAKLIATVESFFHPSNSGAWTADVRLFLSTAFRSHADQPPKAERIHQVYCVRLQQAYVLKHPRIHNHLYQLWYRLARGDATGLQDPDGKQILRCAKDSLTYARPAPSFN